MPKRYTGIKQALKKQGLPEKQASSRAAAIYVSKGKSPRARAQRARSLKHT